MKINNIYIYISPRNFYNEYTYFYLYEGLKYYQVENTEEEKK